MLGNASQRFLTRYTISINFTVIATVRMKTEKGSSLKFKKNDKQRVNKAWDTPSRPITPTPDGAVPPDKPTQPVPKTADTPTQPAPKPADTPVKPKSKNKE